MTWGAVAGAAVSVVGGMMGSDSAGDALQAQEAGAARSDATQRYIYDTNRADNAPFLNNGTAANNRLATLMGLPSGGAAGGGSLTRDQIRSQLLPQYTTNSSQSSSGYIPPYGGPVGGADGVDQRMLYDGMYGGKQSSQSNQSDGQINEAGLNAAIEAQFAQQQAAQQAAQNDPAYGSLMRNFSAGDLASDPVLNASEGYMQPMHDFGKADWENDFVAQNGLQFGLDEGNKAINRQAAATGSYLSGETIKEATRFGNDYGTKNTAGAYDRFNQNQNYKYGLRVDSNNRFNTNRDGQFNKLSAMSGTGQVAAGAVGNAGLNYGNNVSQTAQSLGNAQGASAIAQGNAMAGGITGAYGNYQQNQLLKTLQGRGGSAISSNGFGSGNLYGNQDLGGYL